MALTAYQKHVKAEIKKGKSMKQAAASWNSGKKRSSPKKSSSKTRSKSKPSGGKSMGKRNGFNTQKIFKYVRLGALAMPAATTLMTYGLNENGLKSVIHNYTGFRDGQFDASKLMIGWGPYLASIVTTYGIPKVASILRGL